MALCIGDVFSGLVQHQAMLDDSEVLADRIARNREIAGLHYPSDSKAGVALASQIQPLLSANSWYSSALAAARQEWDPNYPANRYPNTGVRVFDVGDGK
jgi:hypothetical protein